MYAVVCAGTGPRAGYVPAYGPLRSYGVTTAAVGHRVIRMRGGTVEVVVSVALFAWARYLEPRVENDDLLS